MKKFDISIKNIFIKEELEELESCLVNIDDYWPQELKPNPLYVNPRIIAIPFK